MQTVIAQSWRESAELPAVSILLHPQHIHVPIPQPLPLRLTAAVPRTVAVRT